MGLAVIKKTSFDRILFAFKNHETDALNDQQKQELKRWNVADNLIRTYQDSKTIIHLLREKFEISQAQAYRDVANSKRFFGSVNFSDKDYYRTIYAEQLEEYAKLAKMKGDYKAATIAIKEAAEIRGLKDGDEAKELYNELEPCQFIITINYHGTGETKRSEINLDRLEEIEDADFEDVTNAVDSVASVSEEQMQKLLNE